MFRAVPCIYLQKQYVAERQFSMKIQTYYYSDKGDRENNEDALSVVRFQNEILAAAADGLGGYQSGEIASEETVKTIENYFRQESRPEEWLFLAVEAANANVLKKQEQGKKMMSTIAALWIQPEQKKASAVTVGDTRIYQFREKQIIFQSVDHSAAQLAVDAGEISPEQIREYSKRNKLLRAVGAGRKIKSEYYETDITENDWFLLCTDGFWEVITEEQMAEYLHYADTPEQWLTELKSAVSQKKKTKKDNHSAIVLKICGN